MLSGIIINLLSNFIYESTNNICENSNNKKKYKKFCIELSGKLDTIEKSYPGSILSTDSFHTYLNNFDVITRISEYFLGNKKKNISANEYKKELLTKTVNYLNKEREKNKQLLLSPIDKSAIKELYNTLFIECEFFLLSFLRVEDKAASYWTEQYALEQKEEQGKQSTEQNTKLIPFSPQPEIAEYDLEAMEKKTRTQVRDSLIFPWLKIKSPTFSNVYERLHVEPKVKYLNNGEPMEVSSFLTYFENEPNKKLWVLGEAGIGKTTLLKYQFLRVSESRVSGRSRGNALYLFAGELKDNNKKAKYVSELLCGKRQESQPPILFIDGIDEAYAGDIKGFYAFVEQVEDANCEIWLGCRSQYFEQYARNIFSHRIEIQGWEDQAERYVEKYFSDKQEFIDRYKKLYNSNEHIRSFAANPFRLSMLLYLIENEEGQNIENIYSLYLAFFELWLRKEAHRNRETNNHVYRSLWTIARSLYDNKKTCTRSINPAILGLLTTEKEGRNKKRVLAFYHRSFMEFILAKEALRAMSSTPEKVIEKLKFNNRSDVDTFIKAGFNASTYQQKNIMIKNMIAAYWKTKEEQLSLSSEELFYIQNQIVYYMTRMKNMNLKPVENFIKEIYSDEARPIMRQGIAYGAANIGLFDIALNFAKRMSPGSDEDITNRSWTLVFYGDMPEEDPLHYTDDGQAPWIRSRAARLRRLSGKGSKERAFRMFDLCIMRGFYVSRGWKGLSVEELNIIKNCETNIDGYSTEVNRFLTETKGILVQEYEHHLKNG